MAALVGWASVAGGLSAAQVNDHLASAHGWQGAALDAVHRVRCAVWPQREEHAVPAMAPDLLAAQFLTHWLTSDAEQGHVPRRVGLLQALLLPTESAVGVNRLNMLAYDQGVRLGACDGERVGLLQTWLTEASAGSQTVADWLGRGLRELGELVALPHLALMLAEEDLRRSNDKAPEDRALALDLLSFARFCVGDRAGALAPAQELVAIYRRLAQANPAAYEPDLASSLNNLAIRLGDAGDRAGALALAQESVAIYRRLVQVNPAAHEPELASSLNNLASRLGSTGDRAGALALAQESVAIYRRLAQANPAAHEPELAGSLNNLAIRLGSTGDWAGALALALESMTTYRRMVQANPAAFEPAFAMSLGMCMDCFTAVGEWERAQEAGTEALRMFTTLALKWPAVYELHRDATAERLKSLGSHGIPPSVP